MKPNKQEPQKVSVFDCSRDKLILIYFFMFFVCQILEIIAVYAVSLGLRFTPTQPQELGVMLKVFFVYSLSPLLIGINILSKNLNLPNSKLAKTSQIGILCFCALIVMSLAINGLNSRFAFAGYVNRSLAILIYCSVAVYLLHFFRHEHFPKTVLIVALAILTVGELWELPYNIAHLNVEETHVLVFIIIRLHRYVPLFFWFIVSGKVYVNFWREQWYLIVALLTVIVGLTIWGASIAHFCIPLGLRLSYALLLIFLPFHYSKLKRQNKGLE